jgi:hypothetical protein
MADPFEAFRQVVRFHRSVKAGGGYRRHLSHFGIGFRQHGIAATLRKAFSVAVWGMQAPRDSRDVLYLHESGYVFLAGWTDPRGAGPLALRMSVGAVDWAAQVEPCRYPRPDVNRALGIQEGKAGFMVLLRLPPLPLRSEARIWLNGTFTRQHNDPVWLTREAFLARTLEAMAPLFAGDAGECAENARRVQPALCELWRELLDGVVFVPAFESVARASPQASLVVVLEGARRDALPQLHFLAGMLKARKAELIFVQNGGGAPDSLGERLSAFAELHGVDVALYRSNVRAGRSRAMNEGAAAARSDNVYFLDAGVFPGKDGDMRWHAFFEPVPERTLRRAVFRRENGTPMESSPLWGIHRKTFEEWGRLPLDDVLASCGDEALFRELEQRGGKVESMEAVGLVFLEGDGEAFSPIRQTLNGLKLLRNSGGVAARE